MDTTHPVTASQPAVESGPPGGETIPTLAHVEGEHIRKALESCGGNITRAAEVLGLHRRSLQRKLARLRANSRKSQAVLN